MFRIQNSGFITLRLLIEGIRITSQAFILLKTHSDSQQFTLNCNDDGDCNESNVKKQNVLIS